MNRVPPQNRMEKFLIIIFCILLFLIAGGLLLLSHYFNVDEELKNREKEGIEESRKSELDSKETSLDDITSMLPEFCNLNEKIPDITITDEAGKKESIRSFEGKQTVITFWGSWCPDCQEELSHFNGFRDIMKNYGNINYILINRLDGNKETSEKAKQYLINNKINISTYYDYGLSAYKKLGLHSIPTTLFLDEKGIIRAWSTKPITKDSVFEGYLRCMTEGNGKVTGDFVTGCLMDSNGGVHAKYDPKGAGKQTSEVLSETQGIVMEYAVLCNDQQLFNRTLSYITENMWTNGLIAWKVKGDKPSGVNALLDDLRILNALISAHRQWGGYDKQINSFTESLAKYGKKGGQYVDFYDSHLKQYATRFTLCYGDLQTMRELSNQDDRFTKPYEYTKKLVLGGKISSKFPLYYSWYNYKTNSYSTDNLNSAEAMLTLLHLAKADLLPDDSLDWLEEQMKRGGVKARYNVKGEVVEGYNYDSTAVYALIALIAKEAGDQQLQGMALRRMEKMRIIDTSYPYFGAFGMEDGTGINSFDQVLAMLAYEYTK
ncbi:glycosyl hydrolase family 8 [Clostridium boliviensis]|uniref:Glycosyl hydrolase family 8 n=1 Tax=Clostridium boliviensis TaxID=318465 RepID=A0ABU4GS36_9CLOT|nr:glycosyl hydrolase family 8 [Clostridium boliviensis]MDW2799753.1 glycosyl hydrolase family 8 [Clostridium boliviensis]